MTTQDGPPMYVVIDNDGTLHLREAAPTSRAITAEVGDPGWDRVGMPHAETLSGQQARISGWVNDCGHLVGLPRNLVGSCLLMSCGAYQQPYAGPVVLTGWDPPPGDEIVSLTGEQVESLRVMHADIRRVLGLDEGKPSAAAPIRWCRAMASAADMVCTAPTPAIQILGAADMGWS